MPTEWLEREALVIVKAYPNPSAKYVETVCVAAITREEGWVRLYPVQFRSLPKSQRFQKYQRIRLRMTKHGRDPRPESYRPDQDSIQLLDVVDSSDNWRSRWSWLRPNLATSMCELRERQSRDGVSLGCIKPRIVEDFLVEAGDSEWNARKAELMDQLVLFDSVKTKLEKIPYIFRYKYKCTHPKCGGHKPSIIDWELVQFYRRIRTQHDDCNMVLQKVREKFFGELCGPAKDTHFIVGNLARHPRSFKVLGIFWPPLNAQAELF